MKSKNILRILFVAASFVFLSSATTSSNLQTAYSSRAAINPQATSLGRAYAEFGFDVYTKLKLSQGNIIFSAHSLATVLTTARKGSGATTRDQLTRVLRLDSVVTNDDLLAEAAIDLQAELISRDKLFLADAMWADAGLELSPEYKAAAKVVDFRNANESAQHINRWAKDNTFGKIDQIVTADKIPGPQGLILTNAIYFEGTWASKFDVDKTTGRPFTLNSGETVEVPMMHQTNDFLYGADDDYEIIQLPYTDNHLAMFIVLPANGSFKDVEDKFNTAFFEKITKDLYTMQFELRMPKFSMRSSLSLSDVLKTMGITDMFDPQKADFSKLAKTKLYAIDVNQEAFIEIDENGTKAAAVTSATLGCASLPTMKVNVDRPFLFVIKDVSTGTILFLGRVVDPR